MACFFIVHHHGGKIEAQSQPGHGTTFTIRLPLQPERAEPPPDETVFRKRRCSTKISGKSSSPAGDFLGLKKISGGTARERWFFHVGVLVKENWPAGRQRSRQKNAPAHGFDCQRHDFSPNHNAIEPAVIFQYRFPRKFMIEEKIGTGQKALEINLDAKKYGTFAEIGAGQEVRAGSSRRQGFRHGRQDHFRLRHGRERCDLRQGRTLRQPRAFAGDARSGI